MQANPTVVRPGDLLVVPMDRRASENDIHSVKRALEALMPRVDIICVTETAMTSALVYRREPDKVYRGETGEAQR